MDEERQKEESGDDGWICRRAQNGGAEWRRLLATYRQNRVSGLHRYCMRKTEKFGQNATSYARIQKVQVKEVVLYSHILLNVLHFKHCNAKK